MRSGRLVPSHDPVYKGEYYSPGRALELSPCFSGGGQVQRQQKRLQKSDIQPVWRPYRGRVVFGMRRVTTGAQNDIKRATDIARGMVTRRGLSDKLGPLTYGEEEEGVLGRSVTPA